MCLKIDIRKSDNYSQLTFYNILNHPAKNNNITNLKDIWHF